MLSQGDKYTLSNLQFAVVIQLQGQVINWCDEIIRIKIGRMCNKEIEIFRSIRYEDGLMKEEG